jgi:hypothetical protein
LDHRGFDLRPILIVGGVIAAGFGIYKAAPHIKRFVNEKVAPRLEKMKLGAGKPDELDNEPGDAISELNPSER